MSVFVLAQTTLGGAAGPDLLPSVWRTFGALALVLALVVGLAWLLRRGVLSRRAGGALNVESALALGDRRSLVIVTVEGRRLLLGLSQANVSLVAELQPRERFEDAMTKATGQGHPA